MAQKQPDDKPKNEHQSVSMDTGAGDCIDLAGGRICDFLLRDCAALLSACH